MSLTSRSALGPGPGTQTCEAPAHSGLDALCVDRKLAHSSRQNSDKLGPLMPSPESEPRAGRPSDCAHSGGPSPPTRWPSSSRGAEEARAAVRSPVPLTRLVHPVPRPREQGVSREEVHFHSKEFVFPAAGPRPASVMLSTSGSFSPPPCLVSLPPPPRWLIEWG